MDPITVALLEYQQYLKDGGQPVSMETIYKGHKHKPAWKIYPSGLLLCNRKIGYGLMEEHDLIERDIPKDPVESLSHLPGFIIQEAVAKALLWKGALVDYEFSVESDLYKGRGDLLIDAEALEADTGLGRLWAVDVKANRGYILGNRCPSRHNIAQANLIADFESRKRDEIVVPMLYYTLRVDMSTNALYTWDWSDPDCVVYEIVDSEAKVFEPSRTLTGLMNEMLLCTSELELWIQGIQAGEEPDPTQLERCGLTPYDHPFMCARYDRYKKAHAVNCPFFGRCWGVPLRSSFHKEDWDEIGDCWVEGKEELEYTGL